MALAPGSAALPALPDGLRWWHQQGLYRRCALHRNGFAGQGAFIKTGNGESSLPSAGKRPPAATSITCQGAGC